MKKLFLFVATIALTLASCSNDRDLIAPEGSTDGAIEFRTLTDKGSNSGLNKAAITNASSLRSFTVTGIKMTGSGGTPITESPYLFNGFGITKGEDTSNEWDYTPKRYWPTTGTVNFYAYSPTSSKNVKTGEGLLDFNPVSKKSITYTVPQISTTDDQEDFLVARLVDQDQNSGNVKLNFHHALSRVMFFAMTTQKNITYTIDKVELVNLCQTGSLDLTSTSIPTSGSISYASTVQPWVKSGNANDIVNYTMDMGNSPIYVLNQSTSILGKTNAIMVLPQATKLYPITPPATTGSTAPAAGEFAVRVQYKAFVDDIYYAGSATTSAVKYFAVKDPTKPANTPLTFEMGRQYNFMLSFGDEVGDPIKFTVSVSSWNDAPVVHLPEIADYSSLISNEIKTAATPTLPAAITYADLKKVTEITITGSGVTPDLKGIEYFPALIKVSINATTNYDVVDLSRCPVLKTIEIASGGVVRIIAPDHMTSISTSGGSYTTAEYANGNIFKTGSYVKP